MAIGELILGWAFGIISPSIIDRIAELRRRKEVKATIAVELRELEFVLALVVLRLFRRKRILTVERIRLIRSVVEGYDGPEDDPEAQRRTKEYLALPEAEQLRLAGQATENGSNAPRLTKYSLPFVQAHTQTISQLPVDFQWRLSQIMRDLQLYNDQVDQFAKDFDRTFDTSITGENRSVVQKNIERTYESAAVRAERIIHTVRELIDRYKL